jgi:sugar O-acyltransferase (sialic acid O-acetyltransferase NeuD family)
VNLIIYCAGGLGREVYDIARRGTALGLAWKEICFVDDGTDTGQTHGLRQFNFEQFKSIFAPSDCRVVIAHGEPRVRRILAEKVLGHGYRLGSVVDVTARVSASARLEPGVIAFPNTFISSCAIIGTNTLISVGSAIGHDTVVGDHTVVSTLVSISGACSVGSGCYIGTASCIKEKVSIGNNSIIGMGSCVFRDVGEGMIALGNPARETRPNVHQKVFSS